MVKKMSEVKKLMEQFEMDDKFKELLLLEQGSDEWLAARRGRLTASGVCDLMKSGRKKDEFFGKTAMNYIMQRFSSGLVSEEPNITSQAMQWGNDHEQEAFEIYKDFFLSDPANNLNDYDVKQVGFVCSEAFPEHVGCSPDGIITENGIAVGCLEIKCPFDSGVHVETLLKKDLPERWKDKYYAQMQMNMLITRTSWCAYMSYDPRMLDDEHEVVIIRFDVDVDFMKDLVDRLRKAVEIMKQWEKELENEV